MNKLSLFLLLFVTTVHADELNIAVASNFKEAMEQIKLAFEKESKHKIVLSAGSSGKLYAQIKEKAPFDLFFSADNIYSNKLRFDDQLVMKGDTFIYAQGKLVLFSKNQKFPKNFDLKNLRKMKVKFLSMANSQLAPYGQAAEEVLKRLNLQDHFKGKIVLGENIAEAYHFVGTKNADVGFVALSQVLKENKENYFIIPQTYYYPLLQEAVILSTTKKMLAAQEFFRFVKSQKIQDLIKTLGYE